ncbi:MAG: DNA polymerase I [Phycisphaerae bacterium]|nr:DNA polymerase I [Phycisphaerae bacterium]
MPKSFYLIDGHAQIFRAYYAPFAPLNAPGGEPTKATLVFCQMLLNLIRDRQPDYLALVLDTGAENVFRRKIDPQYKANREPPPEDFAPQADRIADIVQAMNIPIFRQVGFEADDLMATVCTLLAGEDLDIYLVSRDKDLEQLISDRVRLYDPGKDVVVDREQLLAAKGYTPEQAIDIQTLAGDSVDNIPGVMGIGPKTAAKLIAKYGSAQEVLNHAAELTPKQGQKVKAFAEQMPVTRQLVTLRRDVDFPFDLSRCSVKALETGKVRPIFAELGFTRLLSQLEVFPKGAVSKTPTPELSTGADLGDYSLVDTPEAFDAFVQELERQETFAFDTETTGLNPVASKLVGLSFSWQAGKGHYIPVRAAAGRTIEPAQVVARLKPIFEDPARRKVGQNLKYDMAVLRQVGIDVQGVFFDTMIADFVLASLRRSHGLDHLAWELLGHRMIPISALIGKGKQQCTIDEVDTARVCEYAGEDADFTWRLYEKLKPQIDAGSFSRLFYETEMPLVAVLCDMECNGVALDTGLLDSLSRSMAERLAELTTEIHSAADHGFNIDSTRQLGVVLFDELKLPVVRKTKTGRSTDAETLETLCRQSDHPLPRLVLEYRELTKLKSTYLDTLPRMVCRNTGRIHASFHQTGAVTGRLSSSDPNLQNIPIRTELGRQIRGAFVAAGSDHVLLTADYSQIELRVLAHFCRDQALLEAFRSGQDIHRFVAAQVNGVPLEQVTKEQRSAAKAVNFGIVYGQGAHGLARTLNISRGAAQTFIDMYFMRYPGIRLFVDETVEAARRSGYAETILGRRRPLPELKSTNRQQAALGRRLAVNTVIQGSAADLIKRAMIDIHQEIKANHRPSRMLIQVHDELVFEVPAVQAEAEAEMVRQKMTQAIPLDVPVEVDIAWGQNWLETK